MLAAGRQSHYFVSVFLDMLRANFARALHFLQIVNAQAELACIVEAPRQTAA